MDDIKGGWVSSRTFRHAQGRSGTLYDALGRSGTLLHAQKGSETLWDALERSGTLGDVLGHFCTIWYTPETFQDALGCFWYTPETLSDPGRPMTLRDAPARSGTLQNAIERLGTRTLRDVSGLSGTTPEMLRDAPGRCRTLRDVPGRSSTLWYTQKRSGTFLVHSRNPSGQSRALWPPAAGTLWCTQETVWDAPGRSVALQEAPERPGLLRHALVHSRNA